VNAYLASATISMVMLTLYNAKIMRNAGVDSFQDMYDN